MLRPLIGVHGIVDDILTHGETEIQHDGRLLTLLEMARMSNLSLNPDKIQFKSTDCKFFGHRLTPEDLKPDPEKVKAIVDMKPLQSIQSLQSFNGMVNYLKRFRLSLDWTFKAIEKIAKVRCSLGMGVWAKDSLWKDQDYTDYTSSLDIFWQRWGSHHTDWCIKDWTWYSLITRGSTHSLCIQSVDRHRVQVL